MTEQELAEFAAEFLGLEMKSRFIFYPEPLNELFCMGELDNTFPRKKAPDIFFRDDMASPILMHLGKREMERRGFFVSMTNTKDGSGNHNGYSCLVRPWSRGSSVRINHANEFIAFWTAINNALNKE